MKGVKREGGREGGGDEEREGGGRGGERGRRGEEWRGEERGREGEMRRVEVVSVQNLFSPSSGPRQHHSGGG